MFSLTVFVQTAFTDTTLCNVIAKQTIVAQKMCSAYFTATFWATMTKREINLCPTYRYTSNGVSGLHVHHFYGTALPKSESERTVTS